MADLKQLQDIVNERAEKRLDEDIHKLRRLIETNRLTYYYGSLSVGYPVLGLKEQEHHKTLRDIFYGHPNNRYLKALKDYWLPIYISEESNVLLKEFQELKDRMNILEGSVDSLSRDKE